MNDIASIAIMVLACAVLLLQLYGRKRLACDRMRTVVVGSFAVAFAAVVVLEFYDRLK